MSPSRPELSLSQIGQIAITVRDAERATSFYRDALGMRYLFAAPGMAFFDCSGVRLMLTVSAQQDDPPPSSILYFRVPDIGTAHAQLVRHGVSFKGAPHKVATMTDHELWMAFFEDGEGNTMALMSEVRG